MVATLYTVLNYPFKRTAKRLAAVSLATILLLGSVSSSNSAKVGDEQLSISPVNTDAKHALKEQSATVHTRSFWARGDSISSLLLIAKEPYKVYLFSLSGDVTDMNRIASSDN